MRLSRVRVNVRGHLAEPAVAVVGSWDPLLPTHMSLFRRLVRYARPRSLASVVIHLEPSPALHLNGPLEWPVYDDVKARMFLVAACGVSASLVVSFRKRDLTSGAKELLELVTQRVRLQELWLGASQSLGTGRGGSDEAIRRLAQQHRIRILRLPPASLDAGGRKVRECLIKGELEQATRIVGRSPAWSRPRSGLLRLAWHPGRYVAAPLLAPAEEPGEPFHLQLEGSGRTVPKCAWPDPAMSWMTVLRRDDPDTAPPRDVCGSLSRH